VDFKEIPFSIIGTLRINIYEIGKKQATQLDKIKCLSNITFLNMLNKYNISQTKYVLPTKIGEV